MYGNRGTLGPLRVPVENRSHKLANAGLAAGFAAFSAAEAWATFFGPDKWRTDWPGWITLGSTIFFSFMTVMCLLAAYFDWSQEETAGHAYITAALLMAGPILLGLVLTVEV